MGDETPAEVLVVAAPSQSRRASRLAERIEAHGLRTRRFPDDDDDDANPARALTRAAARASVVVVLVDRALAAGKIGDASELASVLESSSDKLLFVAVDRGALGALSAVRADVLPTRGGLAELDEDESRSAERHVASEVAAEANASIEPQRADHFNEYRLLFESTERLVERRRGTTQTFLTINAGLSAVVSLLVRDLALSGSRLALVTTPLFVTGMVACRLWQRTILQYESLVDWRYRQLRRMERRRFVGSYRLFGREWDALYAPRTRRRFGFSGLEASVPRVFISLYALGLLFALATLTGVVDRILP